MTTFDAHKNLAYSTVLIAPSPADAGTSLTLASGGGALMPAAPFNLTVCAVSAIAIPSNAEIVRVTNIVGDVVTIVRAQESTTARSIIIGDQAFAAITQLTLTDVENAVNARAGTGFTSGAVAGAVVGGTLNSAGLSLNVPSYITTARGSTDAIGLNTAKTNVTWTANSSGLSLDAGGYAGTGFTSTTTTGTAVVGTLNTAGFSAGYPAFITTGMASNRGSDFVQATAAFAGTNATGTIASGGISVSVAPTSSVVGTSGITLSTNGSSVSIYITASNTNGVSFGFSNGALTGSINSTSGAGTGFTTTTIAGAVVAGTHDSAGLKLAVPGYLTTARGSTDAVGLATAQTNVTWTVNSNGVSFNAGGYAGTGFTSTTTTGTAVVGTNNTAGLSIGVPAFLTNIRVSAGATSNLLSAMTFSNGSGVSWGINASIVTASVDPTSSIVGTSGISISTAGSTASFYINASNANGVSFGFSGNSVLTGSIAPLTAGMSSLGDSVGTSGLVSQQLVFVANGAIQLSQSVNGQSATLSIAAIPPIVSTMGNTLGNTGVWYGAMFLAGSNGITASISTLSQTFNGVTRTNAYLTFMDPPAASQFDPFNNAPVSNSSLGQSTVYFVPFDIPHPISASRINFFLSNTHTFSGAPNNSTAWLALGYAIYSRMSGTGSDRISLATSYSLSYVSASASSSTRLSVTNYIGLSNATSHTTSQYGVNNASVSDYLGSSIAGYRVIALPLNMTLQPGRSWLAVSMQSASQGASLVLAHSMLQNQYSNNLAYRPIGAVSAASNANMYGASDGLGIYSAQTAAFPVSVPLTSDSIRLSNVATLPYFNFSGIGTAAGIL